MKNNNKNNSEIKYLVVEHLDHRVLRPKAAAAYLGANINYFNRQIRPRLPAIKLGDRAIGFDILDLDNWVEQNKRRNGVSRLS